MLIEDVSCEVTVSGGLSYSPRVSQRFTGIMYPSGENGLSRDSHYQYQRLIRK